MKAQSGLTGRLEQKTCCRGKAVGPRFLGDSQAASRDHGEAKGNCEEDADAEVRIVPQDRGLDGAHFGDFMADAVGHPPWGLCRR